MNSVGCMRALCWRHMAVARQRRQPTNRGMLSRLMMACIVRLGGGACLTVEDTAPWLPLVWRKSAASYAHRKGGV